MLDTVFIQQPLQEQLIKVRNKRKNAFVLFLEVIIPNAKQLATYSVYIDSYLG